MNANTAFIHQLLHSSAVHLSIWHACKLFFSLALEWSNGWINAVFVHACKLFFSFSSSSFTSSHFCFVLFAAWGSKINYLSILQTPNVNFLGLLNILHVDAQHHHAFQISYFSWNGLFKKIIFQLCGYWEYTSSNLRHNAVLHRLRAGIMRVYIALIHKVTLVCFTGCRWTSIRKSKSRCKNTYSWHQQEGCCCLATSQESCSALAEWGQAFDKCTGWSSSAREGPWIHC